MMATCLAIMSLFTAAFMLQEAAMTRHLVQWLHADDGTYCTAYNMNYQVNGEHHWWLSFESLACSGFSGLWASRIGALRENAKLLAGIEFHE
jgi:hypothetical protein